MALELPAPVRRFQEIKAKRKEAAIAKRLEQEQLEAIRIRIRATKPDASESQVEAILRAHLKSQTPRYIQVCGRTVDRVVEVFEV